jgi:hypothetical protein
MPVCRPREFLQRVASSREEFPRPILQRLDRHTGPHDYYVTYLLLKVKKGPVRRRLSVPSSNQLALPHAAESIARKNEVIENFDPQ